MLQSEMPIFDGKVAANKLIAYFTPKGFDAAKDAGR